MAGNVFGARFRVMTWGESHGPAVGAVIDGCPAGLPLSEADIQEKLDRRRPGTGACVSARREEDRVEILSGVFEGVTTGTPISLLIRNHDADPSAYYALKDVYRPGHADYTYEAKYGVRDHRGGGRASARETAARVAAGAVAEKLLGRFGVRIDVYLTQIGPVRLRPEEIRPEKARENGLRFASEERLSEALRYLDSCRAAGDSCGGLAECRVTGVPAGLGEPVFDKLDARLAAAVMSVGAVRGVEIGDGFAAAARLGSEMNDPMAPGPDGRPVFLSNHAGGVLGGISTGQEIVLRAAFKPTPSISKEQQTVDRAGNGASVSIAGRHDPCAAIRGCAVIEAMTALVLADLWLEQEGARADRL